MFNNISPQYDFLNRFLSMGVDIGWRKKLVRMVKKENPSFILDLATGTADLAIALDKTGASRITGLDLSPNMLAVGREKVARKNLQHKIHLEERDCEDLPFEAGTVDAVTISFGIRNFSRPLTGLQEMHRVLRPGGKVFVLEFSKPKAFPVKQLFHFYSHYILPFLGKLISKDQRAYTYLPESVKAFPEGNDFLQLMGNAGFAKHAMKRLSFGIASIYIGEK